MLILSHTQLQEIINFETEFVKIFTDFELRKYGVLFYNLDNYTSCDSNHAIIFEPLSDSDDRNAAVKDIIEFYEAKRITPRIYGSYQKDNYEKMKSILENNGFKISVDNDCEFMALNAENKIKADTCLKFERCSYIDESILQIDSEDTFHENGMQMVRTRKVLERSLANKDFHFIVGKLDSVPVCSASIHFNNGIARIDNVETHPNFRNHGYARELMRFIVEYFHKQNGEFLYLYSDNPVAKKIYKEAGFEITQHFDCWSAEKSFFKI